MNFNNPLHSESDSSESRFWREVNMSNGYKHRIHGYFSAKISVQLNLSLCRPAELKEFITHLCLLLFLQDIAQLIIERPTIMTPVLGEGTAGEETYQALLRLYTIALQQAIDMHEGNFAWVGLGKWRSC